MMDLRAATDELYPCFMIDASESSMCSVLLMSEMTMSD